MGSWVIGSGADCDVVVDSPLSSSRHCRLTQTPDGFMLDDLGSTNGTYVNGNRIASPTHVTPGEPITLGRTVPMPWPPEVVRFIRIGRLPDNDIVLDDARVSGHHARLIVVAGSQTLIEDLGSSNGTFLNSLDQRATRTMPLAEADTVYFGTLAVPAARLLAGLREHEAAARDQPPPAAGTEPPAALRSLASSEENRWILASLAQAPIFAVLIVLIFGQRAAATITVSSWSSVAQGIAATTFALALGGSLAGLLHRRSGIRGRTIAGPLRKRRLDDPLRFHRLATRRSRRFLHRGVCCVAGNGLLGLRAERSLAGDVGHAGDGFVGGAASWSGGDRPEPDLEDRGRGLGGELSTDDRTGRTVIADSGDESGWLAGGNHAFALGV